MRLVEHPVEEQKTRVRVIAEQGCALVRAEGISNGEGGGDRAPALVRDAPNFPRNLAVTSTLGC